MFNEFVINNLSGSSYLIIIAMLVLAGSGLIIAFSHIFAKYILLAFINKAYDQKRNGLGQVIYNNHLFHRIAYLIPAIFIYHYSYLFDFQSPHFKLFLSDLISQIASVYILIGISFVLSAVLNCVNEQYSTLAISKQKPIKSYLQVAKIFILCITGILVASIIFDKSPTYFFTGVGAATAFLALIFKDSIMGFIASIQLAAYDMVRIGDWIEMPNFGADGEVTEISLNTVKVQNFDKTIVTIPSYALLTSSIKNWRGMQEAGGRRVKRSIIIDIHSIKICDDILLNQLDQLHLMNKAHHELVSRNEHITNVGLFRIYLEKYLKSHSGVHQEMKMLVRQLQGTPTGLPLELYFFTNEIISEQYEAIQADIIEHAYAMMPKFKLRAFQYAGDTE